MSHKPSAQPFPSSQFTSEKTNRMNSFVLLITCIAAISGILFGFDTGVISGAILFIQKIYHLTPLMNGIVVGAVLLGALLGAAVSGRFADYFGRRLLLILTAMVFLLGTLGSSMADNIFFLVIYRFIVGFAIGISSFTTPLYISEIAPPKFRGALVSLNQLAITIGILCAYGIDTYFSKTGNWRMMFATGMIPAVILFFGMLFLPKSPRWIILKGQLTLARSILQKIRRSTSVDIELKEIQDSIEKKKSSRLLLQKWLLPAMVIGLGLGFFQQFTGINTMIYYAPTIFEMAGFHSASDAISVTTIVGMVNVGFTLLALPLIDLWGRRPLLILGLSGMALGLVVLSLAFHFGSTYTMVKWITMGSMLLYIACFAMSLGPIMWLIIAEIFPLEVRGLGSSLAISASWAFNALVALTFLTLIQSLGKSATFLIYGALSVLGIVFIYLLVPETKGVSLEHIEANLRAGICSRNLGQRIK